MNLNYIYNWFNIGTALKEQQNPSSVGCTVNNSIQCLTLPCHMHDINISLQEDITYKKIDFPKRSSTVCTSYWSNIYKSSQFTQKCSCITTVFIKCKIPLLLGLESTIYDH